MGDAKYEEEYIERKKKLKAFHKKIQDSKKVQEIYHKLLYGLEDEDEEN